MSFPIIDFHNHPTLKPYGYSYYSNENIEDRYSSACIWHADSPTKLDELAENGLGFSPYRESDFTSSIHGRVDVAVVSLYPIETGFVNPTMLKAGSKTLINMISLFGRERINQIKSPSFNYFEDLKKEYNFLVALHNKPPRNGVDTYSMIGSSDDLIRLTNSATNKVTTKLKVIVSIEGAHVFCNGNNVKLAANWTNVEDRIDEVKRWANPPFFITLCHHFNNGLASHAKSLFIEVFKTDLLDQREGMATPLEGTNYISAIGYKVIDKLYKTSSTERQILIDIKHMAKGTRDEFYAYRRINHSTVPIICSHGAVNAFNTEAINLDKSDVKEIFNSNGIFGIELDQRILGYNDEEKKSRFGNWFKNIFRTKSKNEYFWTEYFWKNIITTAEICYDLNPTDNPWKILCLGSDFDGIINPLNKFRTSSTLQPLADNLLKYLNEYWSSGKSKIPLNHCSMDAHSVVYSIMYKNAFDFIEKNYKGLAMPIV